jgi:hypothetical protein
MNAINPFSDPEFKKSILGKEGKKAKTASEFDSFEILQPDSDTSKDLRSMITSAPQLPKSAKNIILDASALSLSEKEAKAAEMNLALNDVFTQYNKTYGTDLQIDFSNLSNTLVNVSDPKTRQTLELYVSEVFKSIRPVLLLHLISRLSLIIEHVLDPKRMLDSNQLSIPDMFLITEKLMQYIDQLNDLYKTTTIENSDQILKKLSEEQNDEAMNSPESKKAVEEFMSLFMKDSGISE